MMKKLFYLLTGGRPMQEIEYYFLDPVTQRPIYRFQDGFGRFWMAHSRWSRRRLESVNTVNGR